MLPHEVYKRRHYGTPQSMLLIITNYAVFAVTASIFTSPHNINWFFWVVMGLLAVYNFFNIRKDRGEYTKARVIAYVISLLLIVLMFITYRLKG
jgi:4-hydroxybenzoate polyprenyltransferase